MRKDKRQRNRRWKGIYGVDRRFTARVDRAKARGQYTEPGTLGNATRGKG